MRKLLLVLALLPALYGCDMFQIHRYDPMTVEQIEATIAFETEDFRLTRETLEDLQAPQEVIDILTMRHESELLRLEAWKMAEEAKKLEDA